MSTIKVVHYINQFYAGIGGEDKAGIPASCCLRRFLFQ